jgi:predicted metalloendopeptidase
MGSKTAKQDAADIVAFETALAKINWTKVENRDPVKTYHKIAVKDLAAYAPGFDWNAYLTATGVSAKVNDVVLYQDTYLKNFAELYAKTPLPVWKAYLKWKVLREYGRLLDKAIVDERFAFYGTTLYGIPQIRRAGSAACRAVDDAIGEALGQVYVAKYFPPESKARMEKLVANLLAPTSRASTAWTGWDPRRRRRRTPSSPR